MFFCFQHKLVTPYSIKYAGVEWPEKAENLRNKLKKDNITAMVISEMVSTDVKLGLAEHFQIKHMIIDIESPNNSNETYTFMCGQSGPFWAALKLL